MLGSFHVDTLSHHPQPLHLESITGYWFCLTKLNRLTVHASKIIMFHNGTILNDYYLDCAKYLAQASATDIPSIKKLTFYHLLNKFGRTVGSTFLSESISRHRFICPHCIAEFGYHSLLWRFRVVTGCLIHNCQLTDQCPSCNKALPLVRAGLEKDLCPYCSYNICLFVSQPLSDDQCRNNVHYQSSIEYLLLPQIWENQVEEVGQKMGAILGALRQAKGLSHQEIGKNIIGKTANISLLLDMERKPLRETNLSFKRYLQYADHVGTTLMQAFEMGYQSVQEQTFYKLYTSKDKRYDELVQKLDIAINEAVQSQGENISVKEMLSRLHMYEGSLRYHDLIDERLKAYVKSRSEKRIATRRQLVHEAIRYIRGVMKNNTLSSNALLAEHLKVSPSWLHNLSMVDWRLRCVLNILTAFASQQRHKLADKQKQQLADRVQSVINEILLENKLTPTQQAIAKKIGTTERALCIAQYHNSYLNDVLENAKSIQRSKVFENLEIEYTNRAQDLLNNALANNQIPTQSVIAESFGMSPASLINRAKSMPALRKVLDEAVRISRQMHSARKEYEALLLVKTAAQRLYFQKGLDFTMEELAREAGRTYQALHVYPTVQLFMAYLSEAKRTKVQMTGDDFTC